MRPRGKIALTFVGILFAGTIAAGGENLNAGALVLVNSSAPDYATFHSRLEPYLVQFGVPFRVLDISAHPFGNEIGDYSLLIVGHRGLDAPHQFLTPDAEHRVLAAVHRGTGLVSFDGLLASWHGGTAEPIYQFVGEIFAKRFAPAVEAGSIAIGGDGEHFITNLRPTPRDVRLKKPMLVPGITPLDGVKVLVRAGGAPVLLAAHYGEGNAVLFSTTNWADPEVKGRLYGLDDLVWRSLVWAARKPFVMRGMPRFLAFRVDDVSGFGIDSNRHIGWALTANRYGLKPWLGVFLDDLREDKEATGRLAELTQRGLATASVHARRWSQFFYLNDPLQTDEAGRNILTRPFPDETIAGNFGEAEQFFAEHHIVRSRLVLPHFYECAPNVFAGLKLWGAEFVGTVLQPGQGYGSMIPGFGPYLSSEAPQASNGRDPIYIADWLSVPGHPEFNHQFFNFIVEIRDVTGYEWAPSGVPVEEAIRRGVEECRREFDSLVPAVLFTHESDHIQHIPPRDWDRILKGVTEQLAPEKPANTALEQVVQYLRALRTSQIESATFEPLSQQGSVLLSGSADLSTKFYVWQSASTGPVAREYEVPAFKDRATANWH
jgi:hypothetical protein